MSVGSAATGELDTAPVLQTKMALRDAWVEHIFWIRNYVFATRDGGDRRRQVAEDEIVANAKVLADSIRPFYGEAASDQLFRLLADHWRAVKAYNTATLNGSTSEQNVATEALSSNAHEIARFLSGANPFLPEGAVFGLLSAHAAHHSAQIDEIEAGDYTLEAATWNAMRLHMLTIADTITEALAQHFPGDFGIE